MFHFLNQHSFVAVALVIFGLLWLVLRKRSRPIRFMALALVLVLSVAFAVVLRAGATGRSR